MMRQRFWSSQFVQQPSRAQLRFDRIVGLYLAITGLLIDKLMLDSTIMAPSWIFAYSFIGIELALLWIFLRYRSSSAPWGCTLALPLLAGGLYCLYIGMTVSLTMGVPFLTAFVYSRNGIRSLTMTPFNLTDSGLTFVRTSTVETEATPDQVSDFYKELLNAAGWRADGNLYHYRAASRRHYSLNLFYRDPPGSTIQVTLELKKNRVAE
jgi:hypothetical protein